MLTFALLTVSCETTDRALTAAGRVARGQTGKAIIDLAAGKDPAQIAKKRLDQYARDPDALLRDLREAKKDFETILAVLGVNVGKTWGKKEVQLPERKKYVKYTQNYKSRAIVNFDSGEILVETLDDQDPQKSLKNAVITTLLTPQDPRSVDLFSDKEIILTDDKEPYLFGLVLDQQSKPLRSPEEAEPFAAYLLEKKYATRVVDQDGTKKTVSLCHDRDGIQSRDEASRQISAAGSPVCATISHQPQPGLRHHPHREQLQPLCRQLGPGLWAHATGSQQRGS